MIPHSCPDIGEREVNALVEVVRSLFVKGGARREALEQQVAVDQGYAYGIATTSGCQALHLALRVLFPRGGAKIGIPSYVCRSVYDATVLATCQPVLLDIDRTHFAVGVECARLATLDAVIVAHMFGIRAPVESYLSLGLPVIEDCAQRITLPERSHIEPRGTIRVLSFEATKLLTCGEGGLLLIDDPALATRARKLRDGPYDFNSPALWLPITDLQAAMALVQWDRLPEFIERRQWLAKFYLQNLYPVLAGYIPAVMNTENNIFFRFLLWVDNPDKFICKGEEEGVVFRRPVAPLPLHVLYHIEGGFPATDEVMAHLVSVPLYPHLSDEEANTVLMAIYKALIST